MKNQKFHAISLLILLLILLTSCETALPPSPSSENTKETSNNLPASTAITAAETEEAPPPAASTEVTAPEATPMIIEAKPEADPVEQTPETQEEVADDVIPTEISVPEIVGPIDFPDGVNPLTGLLVENPALLDLPPALISISNFPASARPQAGLNSSPITFEIAIGEGMTRFLAMFYGQFPVSVSGQTEGQVAEGNSEEDEDESTEDVSIGPIRSGRLPYEDIRSIYSGFLVMASAWEGVSQNLNESTSVFGDDDEDINSAMVGVDKLKQLAEAQSVGYPGSNFNLEGLQFSQKPSEGGQAAPRLWVFYSMLNQIQWHYDEELETYIRYDIKTDGSGEFVMATDRLTGDPISKENVIIVFAEHEYLAPTLIDVQLINRPPTKALLFRDGELHQIFWTTQFGEYEKETGLLRPMRFVDANGDPVPLKPGQTWIHIVSLASYYKESAISEQPFHPVIESPGSGLWLLRYKGKY